MSPRETHNLSYWKLLMSSRTFQVIVIVLVAFTTISATDIFLPSLPSIATYFKASDEAIQLAIPLYLLGSVLAAPLLGVLSDHFGRRPVMLSGLGLFLGGTILCIYSPTTLVFLSARFIQGFGAMVSPVVGWAMIQDLYPADGSAKIISWMGSIISLAPVIAPGIGGYIHVAFGWQGNFFIIFMLAALTLILLLFTKPKPRPFLKKEKITFLKTLKIYARVVADKHFLFYISFFSLLNGGTWCYLTVIPLYFENSLHLSPDILGLYISASASFYILGTLLTPSILRQLGVKNTLFLGIALTLIGSSFLLCLGFLAPPFPLLIVVAMGLYLLGTAIVWGPSTSRALQRFDDIRGAASAVRGLVLMASFALGGFVGSFLSDASLFPLSLFLLIMAMSCLIIFKRLIKLEPQL